MASSRQVRRRRGNTQQHSVFTGVPGEITVDTDKSTVVVQDGLTPGGHPLAKEKDLDEAKESIARRIEGVQTIDDLRAIHDMQEGQSAAILSTGRAGLFRWSAANLSVEVAADTEMDMYVPPAGQNGSQGAWIRVDRSTTRRIVACVLRNTGDGWHAINDATHTPVGVESVTVENGFVKINYDFKAKKVISLVATPDETYVHFGINTGASVGTSAAFIRLSGEFKGLVDAVATPPTIDTVPWWDAAVSKTGTMVEVSHADVVENRSLPTLGPFRASPSQAIYNFDMLISSAFKTGFSVRSFRPVSGRIYFDGSEWKVDMPTDAGFVSAVSATFSGGVLTVIHPWTGLFGCNLNSRSTSMRAVPGSIGTTSFTCRFVDSAGVVATAPTTEMDILFTLPGLMPSSTVGEGMRFHFNRGVCRIDPNNMISPNGNIWVYGVFETEA